MRKHLFIIFLILPGILQLESCIKEKYNMDLLSKRAHLSPTLAISAVKGDIAFSDIVEPSDTVNFGQDNFVTLIFRRESILDLRSSDFIPGTGKKALFNDGLLPSDKLLSDPLGGLSNATLGQWIAKIEPDTLDLGIDDVLKNITGDIFVANPILRLDYTNSFADPMQFDFRATGKRQSSTIDLNLAPFGLEHPADTLQPPVTSEFIIDKSNSSIADIISMLPEKIFFNGTATMIVSSGNAHNDLYAGRKLSGTVQVEIPLEFRTGNLQFTDTTDNFLAETFKEGSKLSWNDFNLFRIDFNVKNGFPLNVTLRMELCDSLTHQVISTVESPDVLTAAAVDSNGKVTSVAASKASLTFTREFFDSIDRSDKIIFRFIMNTTGNGAANVRIYSDYRLGFQASLIVNPDIKFDL